MKATEGSERPPLGFMQPDMACAVSSGPCLFGEGFRVCISWQCIICGAEDMNNLIEHYRSKGNSLPCNLRLSECRK